uniref:Phospholipase A2-like central domain-containing protein n=2 Tax=Ixodes scapularis TaxID=6945 RepID=A0A1S4LJG2_IXOSC
ALIDSVLDVIPVDMVTKLNQNEMEYFLDLCESQNNAITQSQTCPLYKRDTNGAFYILGTKWCGAGDIAKDDNDLGREVETDKCCRDHDNNAGSIGSFEEEHGITNLQIFTMTNCRDDCKFYNCLVNVSTPTSDIIGTIFFNALDAHCYAYGYPEECVQYN